MTQDKRASNEGAKEQEAQIDRFKEAARKLGCDEDETRFDEKLGKLAKPKVAPEPKKSKPSGQS